MRKLFNVQKLALVIGLIDTRTAMYSLVIKLHIGNRRIKAKLDNIICAHEELFFR